MSLIPNECRYIKVYLIFSNGTLLKKAHIMQNMINSDDKMPHTNVNIASKGIVQIARAIPTASINCLSVIVALFRIYRRDKRLNVDIKLIWQFNLSTAKVVHYQKMMARSCLSLGRPYLILALMISWRLCHCPSGCLPTRILISRPSFKTKAADL